jgi:hypothetical protein
MRHPGVTLLQFMIPAFLSSLLQIGRFQGNYSEFINRKTSREKSYSNFGL